MVPGGRTRVVDTARPVDSSAGTPSGGSGISSFRAEPPAGTVASDCLLEGGKSAGSGKRHPCVCTVICNGPKARTHGRLVSTGNGRAVGARGLSQPGTRASLGVASKSIKSHAGEGNSSGINGLLSSCVTDEEIGVSWASA